MNLKKVICSTPGLLSAVGAVWFCSGTSVPAAAANTEPLALKLPAASLAGTPEDLPVGPHIEPPSDKLPAPLLVPKGVTNLAAGRRVTSSDRPATGELSQITDGQKEAFEYDVVEFKKGLQWVQVDLDESRAIAAIVLWHNHRYTQNMHDVIVQVSDDPAFQKDVTTLFSNDVDNSSGKGIGTDREYFESHFGKIIAGKGVKARYVRCHSNGGHMTRLNAWQEIEVYGLPTESNTGDVKAASTNSVAKDSEPLKLRLPAPTLK